MPLRYMGRYRDIRNPSEMVSLMGILDPEEAKRPKRQGNLGSLSREDMVREYNEMQAEQAILLVKHNSVVRAQAQCRSSILKLHSAPEGAGSALDDLFDRYMQMEGSRISLRKEIQCIRRRASYLMNVYHKKLQSTDPSQALTGG